MRSGHLPKSMGAFSSFALSLSVICILTGCVSSLHLGIGAIGGIAVGVGWPIACIFSFLCALALAQLASAFPEGGVPHWSTVLGGGTWGWVTACLSVLGTISSIAAVNVGLALFMRDLIWPALGGPSDAGAFVDSWVLYGGALFFTVTQAWINHMGLRFATKLTNASGMLLLILCVLMSLALLWYTPSYNFHRLIEFRNYSGPDGGDTWPRSSAWHVIVMSFLFPLYSLIGFDAAANTSEETINASTSVPRGIINSVVSSGILGWILLMSFVLAIPDMDQAARQGENIFFWVFEQVLPSPVRVFFFIGVAVSQYFCGLATLTSASRLLVGLGRLETKLASLARLEGAAGTPAIAIWVCALIAVFITWLSPMYSTITALTLLFLYGAYMIPITLALIAWRRSWVRMGPFCLGLFFPLIAVISLAGGVCVFMIGSQPPNENAWQIGLGVLIVIVGIRLLGTLRTLK